VVRPETIGEMVHNACYIQEKVCVRIFVTVYVMRMDRVYVNGDGCCNTDTYIDVCVCTYTAICVCVLYISSEVTELSNCRVCLCVYILYILIR